MAQGAIDFKSTYNGVCMELLSGIFSVIGLALIGRGIAGMIKPSWLTDKKTGNVPKRQDTIIGAVFGAIIMFAIAGWISPEKKTDIENTRRAAQRPQSETSIAQEEVKAKDEVKTKVRVFEKEIAGYDAVSALYIENAKAMTKQVGANVGLGNLYQALQDAQRYAQAGADLVLKT
jgi:uncharacterized membrane protein YeaQ/YmgE (transglycosylase-associated protein family)